jgi:hypothetical protein
MKRLIITDDILNIITDHGGIQFHHHQPLKLILQPRAIKGRVLNHYANQMAVETRLAEKIVLFLLLLEVHRVQLQRQHQAQVLIHEQIAQILPLMREIQPNVSQQKVMTHVKPEVMVNDHQIQKGDN